MTELDAATGAPVRVLTGYRAGVNLSIAIAADSARVWIAFTDASVTELDAATGTPVLNGSPYRFKTPAAIAADGNRVWVGQL